MCYFTLQDTDKEYFYGSKADIVDLEKLNADNSEYSKILKLVYLPELPIKINIQSELKKLSKHQKVSRQYAVQNIAHTQTFANYVYFRECCKEYIIQPYNYNEIGHYFPLYAELYSIYKDKGTRRKIKKEFLSHTHSFARNRYQSVLSQICFEADLFYNSL